MDNWNRIVHYSVALSVFASLTMAVAGYSVFVRSCVFRADLHRG